MTFGLSLLSDAGEPESIEKLTLHYSKIPKLKTNILDEKNNEVHKINQNTIIRSR